MTLCTFPRYPATAPADQRTAGSSRLQSSGGQTAFPGTSGARRSDDRDCSRPAALAANRDMLPSAVPAPVQPASERGHAPKPLTVQEELAPAYFLLTCRYGEAGLDGLSDGNVPLPAFVFHLDVLKRDSVGIGIEVWKGLILGDPAPEYVVGQD